MISPRLMKRPWIRTASGRDVFLDQPRGITIEDVAASLAKINRFNGHTRVPYSVAQHSVWISRRMQEAGYSTAVQLAGLMHDAAEAYLGDLTSPAQMRVFGDSESGRACLPSAWKEAQTEIDLAIVSELKLPVFLPGGTIAAIKFYDLMALRTEWRDLMLGPEPADFAALPEAHPEPIRPFENWQTAQEQFFARFHTLTTLIECEALA